MHRQVLQNKSQIRQIITRQVSSNPEHLQSMADAAAFNALSEKVENLNLKGLCGVCDPAAIIGTQEPMFYLIVISFAYLLNQMKTFLGSTRTPHTLKCMYFLHNPFRVNSHNNI